MKKLFASEQRKTRWQVGNTEAVKNALQRSDAGWFKRMMQASMITNKIGDSARVMEAVFDEERTTDKLIDAIADLAAGLNPIVRDARMVMEGKDE